MSAKVLHHCHMSRCRVEGRKEGSARRKKGRGGGEKKEKHKWQEMTVLSVWWLREDWSQGFISWYEENWVWNPNDIALVQRGPSFFRQWWKRIWSGSYPSLRTHSVELHSSAHLWTKGVQYSPWISAFLKNNFLPASIFVTFSPRLLSVIFAAFFPSWAYEDIHPAQGDHQ